MNHQKGLNNERNINEPEEEKKTLAVLKNR